MESTVEVFAQGGSFVGAVVAAVLLSVILAKSWHRIGLTQVGLVTKRAYHE